MRHYILTENLLHTVIFLFNFKLTRTSVNLNHHFFAQSITFLQNRTRKRDKRLTTQNSCKILDGYSRRHHFSNDSRYKTSPALRVKRTSKWSVAAERVHLLSTVSAFHFVKGTGNLKGTGIEVDNVRKSFNAAASF